LHRVASQCHDATMSEWHLDELRAALTNRGWKVLAVHPGDDYAVSGSWEIERSTRYPPLFIDFNGLDDDRCLPIEQAYVCEVRGGKPDLYFHRPGDKWRAKLKAFVLNLDILTSFPGGTLQVRRVEDRLTMEDVLVADRAILCLHAEWSTPSVMAWKSFHHWVTEREVQGGSELIATIATFVAVNGNGYPPPVAAWLKAQGLDGLTWAGGGEILWLESGRVVSKLVYSHEGILDELTRRTADLWGLAAPCDRRRP
jgi:hypothetical protein